jgi:hypothetical protein
MPKRPITALAAALALLVAAPAVAQDPPEDASPAVEQIYDDYRDDGRIERCDHERADLEDARDTIEPDFDRDYPDFRVAVEARIADHDNARCDVPTATPTADATVEATAEPLEEVTPESGALPPVDDGSGGDDGGAIPPEDGTLPPEESGVAPESASPAPPPAPTAAPPAAATTPVPSPTPVIVSRSGTDRLLVPGIVVALALLGALALAAFAIASRRSPRLHHAWREAAFRTRGTWADFSDWLRLGR